MGDLDKDDPGNSGNEGKAGDQQAAPDVSPATPRKETVKGKERSAHQQSTQQQSGNEADALKKHELWDLVFSACLVLFALVASIIAGWQGYTLIQQNNMIGKQNTVMVDQLGAMRDQNTEIIKQTKAMQGQLEVMAKQTDAMVEQNNLVGKQLELSAKAVEQTDKMIDQMRNEQRAWISIQPPTIQKAADGTPIRLTFDVKNVGKTPAKITGYVIDPFFFKSGEQGVVAVAESADVTFDKEREGVIFQDFREQVEKNPSEIAIAPDESLSLGTERQSPLGKRELEQLGNQGMAETIFYFVAYTDVQGNKRSTLSHFVYSRALGQWVKNPRYNRME